MIVLMEVDSGIPVQTEDLMYGSRVAALVLPAPDKLLTPAAVKVFGPRAFGYDVDVTFKG
jgi:DUF917 family protein